MLGRRGEKGSDGWAWAGTVRVGRGEVCGHVKAEGVCICKVMGVIRKGKSV